MSILFHNTMRITDGHLEEFAAAVKRAVAFVEEHGPQLMVQVFLDEERGLAHSFQLYPDSDAVLRHWQLSDPYIQDVMAHCTVQSFDTYGELSDEVIEGLRSGPAGEPTVRPALTGFTRFEAMNQPE
ncbi:hypothetical protein IU510_13550 [Nocardia cyriacigeorgica]|uniref:hypothetical protein n=1 Tax=Nocardia cyriacigeorgica TaxID=135487 RepID=UPI001894DD16|nr:hypothetical protein [Nocardia cyriacigeorgica]MBF6099101.1 hypothetical protein [Nocardia cyriacigeorgica]MBF6159344.1 hypothetical protein [Nocardia cyriacigeorgica]MBF6198427.1 hypothetical protein [Nocardia cyriacigeorgica]MBF6315708.1 hypothetical protein [Nocardia cyriacigeorgica]MBF6342761.1 hypothetical protein [Nocardia cyriacigeorgica]